MSFARIRKQPKHRYVPSVVMGTQREAREPDEAGALVVVDLLFGGRLALFDYGDKDWLRAARLP